jgi:hypothetical protein
MANPGRRPGWTVLVTRCIEDLAGHPTEQNPPPGIAQTRIPARRSAGFSRFVFFVKIVSEGGKVFE